MTTNSYSPPKSPIDDTRDRAKLDNVERWVIGLIVAQVLATIWYGGAGVEIVRNGELAPISALALLLATVFLVMGALLLSSRPSAAKFLFGISAVLGILLLSQWRPLLVVTCTALAVLSFGASVRRQTNTLAVETR